MSISATELRRRAEEQLNANAPEPGSPLSDVDTQRLLHELQVHQIELEVQNAELRQARDDVETALEKYADLYDFAPVGYFTLDDNGIISAVNLAGAALLGIERNRLTGLRFGLFVADEALPFFAEFLGKIFARRGTESCELPLTTDGKSPFFVQIEAMAFGSVQECRVAVIDITERKRTEAEIQRIASFPLMNPNPVLEFDADGTMTFCNPAAMQILENARYTIGINPFIPHDMPAILQRLRDNKTGQFIREIEINSCFFEELIFISPQFTSVRIYTMDITDRKRAEKELEILHNDLAVHAGHLAAANSELEAFTYTVSHDLRRPLTVIHSYCQLVQSLCGNKLEEQCQRYMREMYDGTLRMNRLIDTLLKFSCVTRVEMYVGTVDLSKIAKAVAEELKLTAPENRVTFRIAEGIQVNGDAGLLRVVQDNLIGNAWKYAGNREGTVIEFDVTEVEGKPTCFVRDNGPGFDMAHAEKLFIPFQRLPGADKIEGHGIGLATVERIIKRHGGKVWAEGAPGKGACFYFTLSAE